MKEVDKKLKEFLEDAIRKRNEPETQQERRKKIYKRLKKERKNEKSKYGL